MEPDRLLDGLNDAQRRAVTTSVVPLCILAGAGSGKTRVLTRRIAYRAAADQHDPRRVLALTFTRKAAGEMTGRLRQLGLRDTVAAGTFHAVAYAQLRSRWADRNIQPPTLLEKKVGFVARLLPRTTPPSAARSGRGVDRAVVPLDVVAEIEWAKARCVTPEHYPSAAKAANRKPPLEVREIARIFDRYENEKRNQRMVDFDDLLSLCTRDLRRDEEFAAAQRWRYRHFFVDEYQDVNPLQQALLEAWLGDRTDLCVVGDPNQAIYTWNGADTKHLVNFTERWQRGEVVRLDDNYRSTPQVLAVANAILNDSREGRRAADRNENLGALRANRPDGPVPVITSYQDDRAEANGIARAVRDHAAGRPWSAQAVLVRTNAQVVLIEDALRRARIPFRVKGGSSLLEQPEIKAALRELKGRREPFAVTLTDLEVIAGRSSDEARVNARAQDDPEDEVTPEADSRQANLQTLVRLGHDYAALDPYASTSGFLTWVGGMQRADHPDATGDAVEIATFHSAKGLEWPTVHLAGLELGLVPIGHAKTAPEMLEERRLFYVATTRAERELICSWAQTRTFGTRVSERERSPYLATVETATSALTTGDVPADWATFFRDRGPVAEPLPLPNATGTVATDTGTPGAEGGVRLARQVARDRALRNGRVAGALSTLSPSDQVLFDALKVWRAEVARAASTSASVVFHDSALEAVARAQPTTVDELLAVEGVGALRANRHGPALLALVAGHLAATNA